MKKAISHRDRYDIAFYYLKSFSSFLNAVSKNSTYARHSSTIATFRSARHSSTTATLKLALLSSTMATFIFYSPFELKLTERINKFYCRCNTGVLEVGGEGGGVCLVAALFERGASGQVALAAVGEAGGDYREIGARLTDGGRVMGEGLAAEADEGESAYF